MLSLVHIGGDLPVFKQRLSKLPGLALILLVFLLLFPLCTTDIVNACRVVFEDVGGSETTAEPVLTHERARESGREQARSKPLDIPLPCVRSARVQETRIWGFPNRTLIVELKGPMRVTSTLEGERHGIYTIGNHYSPPPCWEINHRLGFERSRNHIHKVLGKARETSSFLFTGADMNNLSTQKAQFRDMVVYALVTAGVESNAMRMAVDEGRFYEPGTINMVILTNMRLSSRARARAIISATEAKTSAMQDLDVRSAASAGRSQATGTGTDEIIVVEGRGIAIDNAGGHCKMGELIARAVYNGVKEAVQRQNGITAQRGVFRRLRERGLDLDGLIDRCNLPALQARPGQSLARLEELLRLPRYASFIEAAFALSDAHERGQLTDLALFEGWCRSLADEIAGGRLLQWTDCITSPDIPPLMRMSLNALLNGLATREQVHAHGVSLSH